MPHSPLSDPADSRPKHCWAHFSSSSQNFSIPEIKVRISGSSFQTLLTVVLMAREEKLVYWYYF